MNTKTGVQPSSFNPHPFKSNVGRALEALTVFDVWGEAPYAESPYPLKDGVYVNPFKVSLNRTPSLSISKDGKRWKDFSNNLPAGGVKAYVEACHPDWGKIDVLKFIVEKAGLVWHENLKDDGPAQPESERDRARRLREERLKARQKLEEARDAMSRGREAALEWPDRGPDVPALSPEDVIWDRWHADPASEYFYDPAHARQLADWRGWPVDWVRRLADADALACPELPWSTDKRVCRGLALPVLSPDEAGLRLALVGYHQVVPRHGSWMYVPHVPSKPRTAFQRRLAEMGRTVPALPFVLGDPRTARVAVVTEGQWDAITLWGALGGFDGVAEDVLVFGIRGVSGADVWLSYWGGWLRSRKPAVWLLPDNDEQGRVWYDREALPRADMATLEERLNHGGLTVARTVVPRDTGKDFNDFFVTRRRRGLPMDAEWLRRQMERLWLFEG